MKIRSARERLTPHFTKAEMACRCRRPECDAVPMNPKFMSRLEALRNDWGMALIVTSGSRCSWWNDKIGGAEKSRHVLGEAADFHIDDLRDTPHFVELAEKHGFGGIGQGQHLVHLDDREVPARWRYKNR